MALKAQITINETLILEVDSDPSIDGVDAPLSSIALLDNDIDGKAWIKTSALSTGWTLLNMPAVDLSGYLKRDGTLPMTGNLNMDNNKIVNLADPTSSQEAANKRFVQKMAYYYSLTL